MNCPICNCVLKRSETCVEEFRCQLHGTFYVCTSCTGGTVCMQRQKKLFEEMVQRCNLCGKPYCVPLCWPKRMMIRETVTGLNHQLVWICNNGCNA